MALPDEAVAAWPKSTGPTFAKGEKGVTGFRIIGCICLVVALPPAALGQDVDPNTTVTSRAKPGYDPLGIRAGAFIISPELRVASVYSDNVGRDEDDEQSDIATLISPIVAIKSNWSVHSLAAEVGSEIAIHKDEGGEDYQDVFANAGATIDVSRQTNLALGLNARRSHVDRDDPDDVDEDELTDLYLFGGAVGLQHQFNRIGIGATVEAQRSLYDEEEDDQDEMVYDFLLRTSYELSPRIAVFGEGRYNIEDRIQNVDDDGFERDSDGYELRLGTEIDLTAVLFGEVFAGYRVQRFDDDFGDETGLSFGVDLNWNPTQLTSVGLTGTRDFEATDEAGAASNFNTSVALSIDHELLRNVIVSGEASYSLADFRNSDREEDTIGLGVGAQYWLNRNITLETGYRYSTRDSNQDDESFTANDFEVGIAFKL